MFGPPRPHNYRVAVENNGQKTASLRCGAGKCRARRNGGEKKIRAKRKGEGGRGAGGQGARRKKKAISQLDSHDPTNRGSLFSARGAARVKGSNPACPSTGEFDALGTNRKGGTVS